MFMDVLRPLLPDSGNARLLRDWDFRYDPESRAASLFEDFYSALRKEIFSPGGLGGEVTDHLANETGIFIDFYAFFDALMLSETSSWFGGRSRSEIWSAAFSKVDGTTPVPWGERNLITMTNMFFGGKLPRFFGFDKGPFALRGGRATPHQGQIYRSAGRVTSFAPSLRIIADMGEDALHTCIAGGPSDRRFSKWYDSDVGRYKTLVP
jgi:penicillin amidase